MVETETENMLKDMEQRLAYQGLKLDQYLQMMGKTKEEMQKEYEPQAIEAIKSRLAIEAVIKAEKIEVPDIDIEEKMKEMAKNYGRENDEEFMKNENVKNALIMSIRHFPCSLLLVAIYGTFVLLLFSFPPFGGLLLCCGAGLIGYFTSNIFVYIFRKYIPDELENDLEASGEHFE